ncbi:MAG: aminotransferase class [Solirubrobacterales bacterium]|nr:aminotransferase class [Solirubrobacterales bacterium]
MGLLDYYRQFSETPDEEIRAALRADAQERRQKALSRVEPLDLSATTWPGLPHPDIVAAITFAARGSLERAPDPHAGRLRRELAHRHALEPERIVVGHGAAQLLTAAARALLGPGDELVTPWPSYGLLPRMARDAGARAVPVEGGFSAERIVAAITERTRVVALCNPNDPTGELLPVGELGELIAAVPERVWVLLDEALRDYVDAEPVDATLTLLDQHPRLLVFRTLSKAYGLAGLRCGWALGPPGAEDLLERLAPELGVGTMVQAGALEAVRRGPDLLPRRRRQVAVERDRLLDALHDLPLDAAPSQANVLWLRAAGLSGEELAGRLGRLAVIVLPGSALGDPDHVRVQVQDAAATDRLLTAVRTALGQPPL